MPKGYSATQIALHWIVVVLVVAQYLLAEGMEEAWDAAEEGGVAAVTGGARIHVLIGAAVLVFALWRLALRFSRGTPGPAPGETPLQSRVARVTHVLLYVLMIGLPLGGAAAWFGGIEEAADLHASGTTLLLILIGLHVLGAVYNQWVLRNGLIRRMMRPEA